VRRRDVGVPVTIDVERLAESESELAARDVPGDPTGQAPAGAAVGTRRAHRRDDLGPEAGARRAAPRRAATGAGR